MLLALAIVRGLLYPFFTNNPNPGPDGYDYLRVAHKFLAEPFPWKSALDETVWAPGWPAVMAILWSFTGESIFAVRMLNVVMWLAALGLSYRVVRRTLGEDVALLAVTFLSWDDLTSFIKYSNYEIWLTLLVVALTAALLEASDRDDLRWMTGAGAIAGVACLVQSKMLVPAAVAALYVAGRSERRLRHAAVFFLALWLVVLPYSYRNWVHEGRFSFVGAWGPANLLIGNGPQANGQWTPVPPPLWNLFDKVPPDRQMAIAKSYVLERAVTRPKWFFLENIPRKFWFYWDLEQVRHNLILVLMAAGIALLAAGRAAVRPQFLLLVIPWGAFFVLHMVFFGLFRYRYPTLFVVHAMVAVAVLVLADREKRAGAVRPAVLGAAVAVALAALAHYQMRPAVLHGRLCLDDGKRIIISWATTDEPVQIHVQPAGGAERRCEPLKRIVDSCYYAPAPPDLKSGPATLRVKSADGARTLFEWTQDLADVSHAE